MLPLEQIEQIKQQIIQQVEANFPEDKKESAKQQINSMNSEQLEQFLEKNKLVKTQQNSSQNPCIFCSIVSGDVQSNKIDENKDAIAILEINPISKGHTLILPKEHLSSSEKLSQNVFSLAENIAKKIKTKLKPKDVKILPSNLFGHEIINVLPIYKDETLASEKHQAKPEELEEVQKIILKEKKIIKKPKIEKIKGKIWLPKRIP